MGGVEIWSDGSCPQNPGDGAWAAILVHEGADGTTVHKPIGGGVKATTNNRCELLAVIHALRALKRPCEVVVHTDSKYVMDGFTKWLPGWKRRGWRTAARSPVVNQDLWEMLDAEAARHRVSWEWHKGHRGVPLNERADKLAAALVPADDRTVRRAADLDRDFDLRWRVVWAHE